jgi:hypothetical protein
MSYIADVTRDGKSLIHWIPQGDNPESDHVDPTSDNMCVEDECDDGVGTSNPDANDDVDANPDEESDGNPVDGTDDSSTNRKRKFVQSFLAKLEALIKTFPS